MDFKDISNLRLINQQVTATKFKTAKDIVGWLGAMQAQDFNMVKWAIGIRLPNSTEKMIELAIDKGEIIRTHLLRPTWHFVSPEDINWMLELTAPKILASMKSRDKVLGLTDAIYRKSNDVIVKALSGGHLTRETLIKALEKAKIGTGYNRASHLFFRAELAGIMCSGSMIGGKPTYALLTERVPKTKTLKRDEALAQLAKRYFTSHGPATLQDFSWWSGLSVADSKNALEMVKSNFVSETIDKQTYWVTNSFTIPNPNKDLVNLLPAFDEFIISYKDRTASLPHENHIKAVSNNGIFRPVIVINGQVIGIWKRAIIKNNVVLETTYFQPINKAMHKFVEEAFMAYAGFLNKKVMIPTSQPSFI